jgi:hypothetical protein
MRRANSFTDAADALSAASLPSSASARLPTAAVRKNTWSDALTISRSGFPVSMPGVAGFANAGFAACAQTPQHGAAAHTA